MATKATIDRIASMIRSGDFRSAALASAAVGVILTADEKMEVYAKADADAGAPRLCGPDHDCRSTGCDDSCPACN